MAFTITGTIGEAPRTVSWDAGELDGDAEPIDRAELLVAGGETVWATPTGPHFTAELADPSIAFVTLLSVFDSGLEILVTGELPSIPDSELPPGAIA